MNLWAEGRLVFKNRLCLWIIYELKTTNKVYKTHTGFDNGKDISEVKIRDIKIGDEQIFARNNYCCRIFF